MASTQMNIRIDRDTKLVGDDAFSAIGYTPTEVVRAVWEFAARNRNDEAVLRGLIQRIEDDTIGIAAEEKLSARLQAVEEGARLVETLRGKYGYAPDPIRDDLTWDELEDEAYLEEFWAGNHA